MIATLIERARARLDCVVEPPIGQPLLAPQHQLPADVQTFYTLCGGIHFFTTRVSTLRILRPTEIQLSNEVILGPLTPEDRAACANDRSWAWYIIAGDDNGDYISFDTDPARAGRCYDSFWDRHGVVGSCPVIARTFTELVTFLLSRTDPQARYWVHPDFPSLGDAYD